MCSVQNENKKHPPLLKGQHDDFEGTVRFSQQNTLRVCSSKLPHPVKKQSVRAWLDPNIKQHFFRITMQEQQEQFMCTRDILVPFYKDIDKRVFWRVTAQDKLTTDDDILWGAGQLKR